MGKRLAAEFIGTLWLVLGGCGSAVLAAAFPNVGIGLLGRLVRFRPHGSHHGVRHWTCIGMSSQPRCIGWIMGRRNVFQLPDLVPYIVAQVGGAIACAAILYVIASGNAAFDVHAGFAVERLWRTFPRPLLIVGFVGLRGGDDVRISVCDHGIDPRQRAERLCAHRDRPLPDLIYLISIPVTNTIGQPRPQHRARPFAGDWAISQLWLFWVAPIVGAILAGVVHPLDRGRQTRSHRCRRRCLNPFAIGWNHRVEEVRKSEPRRIARAGATR